LKVTCKNGHSFESTDEITDFQCYCGDRFNPRKVDVIEHPKHYTQGIEAWDYIVSHNLNFLEGNIIKYVTRYKLKNGREDLLKAQAYLNRLLKEVK